LTVPSWSPGEVPGWHNVGRTVLPQPERADPTRESTLLLRTAILRRARREIDRGQRPDPVGDVDLLERRRRIVGRVIEPRLSLASRVGLVARVVERDRRLATRVDPVAADRQRPLTLQTDPGDRRDVALV
jgi:hypothetical protein